MIAKVLSYIGIYFFIMFIASRFFIPHLRKEKIPGKIPGEMEKILSKIKKKNKKDFAKACFDIVVNRYPGKRILFFLHPQKLFYKDINKIWADRKFQACTIQNYILRVMLIKSGHFKEEDIKLGYGSVNFVIHPYIKVNIDGEWVNMDPWGYKSGILYGKYALGFM